MVWGDEEGRLNQDITGHLPEFFNKKSFWVWKKIQGNKTTAEAEQQAQNGSHHLIGSTTLDSSQLRRPRAASEQSNYNGSQTIKQPRVQQLYVPAKVSLEHYVVGIEWY